MDRSGFYRGTVVSNADPDGLYRVRADVPQLLGVSTMGWCRPMMGAVNGIPAVGEQIWVGFEAGDVNYPLYIRSNTLTVDSLSDGTVTTGTGLDTRTPNPPQNLVITSVAYIDGAGNLQGRVTATWDAVTDATDGTVINIGGYELWGRPTDIPSVTGTWVQITASNTLVASWAPFAVGSAWEFMVRAQAVAAPTLGAYSFPVTHTVSSAVDAPLMPPAPTVTSGLGLVNVFWDGKNSSAGPMPATFAHVEVAIDLTAAPSTPTLYGALPASGTVRGAFTIGTVQYVRMRSVDIFGTHTAWTTAIPVTVLSVYQDQIDALNTSVAKINGAVIITQGSSPSVTVTDGAINPTEVQITPSGLALYYQGQSAASISGDVSGGLMLINAIHVGHHLIRTYDSGNTIVTWHS